MPSPISAARQITNPQILKLALIEMNEFLIT